MANLLKKARKSRDLTRAQRMLLGLAIGDAFGRGYEGRDRNRNLPISADCYKDHKGVYTDDTQMSIGVAETLLSDLPMTPELLASNFVYAYRRDIHKGYSSRTKEKLLKAYCGKDFLELAKENPKPTSNGSAMRAMPFGVLASEALVKQHAMMNSEITHNHPESIAASAGIALAGHFFYHEKGKHSKVISYVRKNIKGISSETDSYLARVDDLSEWSDAVILEQPKAKGLPCNARLTLGTVLFIIKHHGNQPFEALTRGVRVGGDVDSITCLVLGAILMFADAKQLPDFLIEDLENGQFGRDYLLGIGKSITKRYLESP